MGCTDRGSNYNALVYSEEDRRWWAHCEWDRASIEAPTKDMVLQKLQERYSLDSLDGWDFVQLDSGRWKATRKKLLGVE